MKVAVVGVGKFGSFHAEKYSKLNDVELVGVVDTDEERAKEVAGKFNTQSFLNYEDLYDKVEAVSIAVPTRLHYQVARDFLMQGKDVLLEKPITAAVEEAEKLIEVAGKNGRILQVGHVERFNTAAAVLGEFLNHPRFIECHRLSSFKGRGTDVDVILDLMIHDIDMILNFVKRPVEFINAAGIPVISTKVDIANARIQFEGGCVANITVSRISDKNMRKVRIFQPNAYFSLDYANGEVTSYKKIDVNGEPKIVGEKKKVTQKDSLAEEIASFINSVITRRSPMVSGKEGRDALSVAIKIQEQIHQNEKVLEETGK